MECPRCGTANRAERRFCSQCGSPLTLPCPACGFGNDAEERFCGGCGTPLVAEPGGPEARDQRRVAPRGERKQVTVLFADVVGFTPLSERLDPETVHELMDGCFALLTRAVERYGGSVNAFTGDGAMALFGAPVTDEHHALRALHAALHIREQLAGYEETVRLRWGVPFQMRIGVNTGLVVAGEVGDHHPVEYTALGDTINLAARLQQAAPPGEIWAGESTHRVTSEAFTWRAMAPLSLKGKSEPVQAYELVAPSTAHSRFEMVAQRGLTSFVGRQAEFEQLRAAWARVEERRGQVVSIVGEAGLGKSRLLHEFKQYLNDQRARVHEGSCFTYGETISYLPFVEILKSLFDLDGAASETDTREVVDRHLAELDLNSAEITPYLLNMLGLAGSDDLLADQSAAVIRSRTLEALREVVVGEAATGPMALVVEDVHWIDKASEEVLSVIVEAMTDVPLMVLVVYRPEYLHAWGDKAYHAEISLARLGGASSAAMVRAILSKPYAARINLEQLSSEESRAMVQQLLGTAAIPPELEKLIETHTDGNPLFIEELTVSLMESGDLVREGDRYLLARSPESLALPTTVQGVLLARIDRLNPELRTLLQIASVLGRVFSHPLLSAVAGLNGALDEALLQLEDLDFVRPTTLAPERQYSFKHVLAQEAVYQTLLRAERETYHERAGRVIEGLYSERLEEFHELLAYHYTRSADAEKALEYLDLASRKAMRANAMPEARAYFDEAMRLLDRMPDTPGNRHRRVSMLAHGFFIFWLLYRIPEYLELALRYESQAEQLDDPQVVGAFYCNMAYCQWIPGDFEQFLETANRVVKICERAGNPAGAGLGRTSMLMVWYHLAVGNYDDMLAWKPKAIAACQRDLDITSYLWCHTGTAIGHTHQGQWQRAEEECAAALRVGREYGDEGAVSRVSMVLSMMYTARWDVKQGIEHGERAVRTAPTPADKSWGETVLGWAWCRAGQPERAVEVLAGLAPLYEAVRFCFAEGMNLLPLGEAYLAAGQLAKAQETLEVLVERAGRSGMRYYLGGAHRLLAEVAWAADRSAEGWRRAEDHFQRSITLLQTIGAENELAKAYAGYGRICHQRGDSGTAREYLTRALGIFERLGTLTEPDLVRETLAEIRD